MLSITIPTMRRWSFLKDSIPLYLEQSCVKEVLVCDETGEDAAAIEKSTFAQHPKLRVLCNTQRLGIYQNKRKCLAEASGPWVALLDSDNLFPEEWFEHISELLQQDPEAKQKRIYASAEFLMINQQTGTSEQPCLKFSGLRISDAAAWNNLFTQTRWNFLLNDGNWVVPKEVYNVLPASVKSSDLQAADAIFMLREWIRAGFSVEYVKGLVYHHLVHTGSSWLQTEAESTRIFNTINWRL